MDISHLEKDLREDIHDMIPGTSLVVHSEQFDDEDKFSADSTTETEGNRCRRGVCSYVRMIEMD